MISEAAREPLRIVLRLPTLNSNIKIIIEKKGMVRRDEKFSVPLTYKMEQQSSSWLPEARRNAFLTGGIIPSPSEDPRLYATHQSRKVVTKSGIFTLKDVDTTIRLELPDPLLYARKLVMHFSCAPDRNLNHS